MNWTTYWAAKQTQPKTLMKKHSQYLEWLQDKNLSQNTITSYLNALKGLPAKLTTQNLKEYFKANLKRYEATTLKVRKYALNSYVKFKKLKIEWEKIARLIPSVQRKFFDTITENEFSQLKEQPIAAADDKAVRIQGAVRKAEARRPVEVVPKPQGTCGPSGETELLHLIGTRNEMIFVGGTGIYDVLR